MAPAQLEQGFTRVPNRLLTALSASALSVRQVRAVLIAVRLTYGFHREAAAIGTSAWQELLDLDRRSVRRLLAGLEGEGVLVVAAEQDEQANKAKRWAVEPDYTRWGRYSVTEDQVLALEALVASHSTPRGPKAPRGSKTPRGQIHPGGQKRAEARGAETPPGPGGQKHPGGSGQEALPLKGSEPRKERGKKGKETFPPLGALERDGAGRYRYPEEFEAFWSAYPDRPDHSKSGAYHQWWARITKDNESRPAILAGAKAYARFVRHEGREPSKIKQATTFLSKKDRHWLNDYSVAANSSSPDQNGEDFVAAEEARRQQLLDATRE